VRGKRFALVLGLGLIYAATAQGTLPLSSAVILTAGIVLLWGPE
jgi:hypothetical protein